MKKTISILMMLLCVATVFAQQNSKKIQRFGAGGDIAAISGSGFAYGGTIEYKYLNNAKDLLTVNHVVGINGLIGITMGEGVHFLVGGGYEQNITSERGQPYGMVKFNSPVVAISGKLLFSQFKQYKNNYEVALSVFPGQNIFGVGGFYLTDYDCTVVGVKLTFRFGKTNGGSSKKRDDCTICGL